MAENGKTEPKFDLIGKLSEQEADSIVTDLEFRTEFLIQSLICACKSRRIFRVALSKLIKEGIILVDDVDSVVARSIPGSDELSDSSLDHEEEGLDSDIGDESEDIPDVDSLLQMEVFNSSAVKNIGRFNCEFLRYEKLGQGGFGCGARVAPARTARRCCDAAKPPRGPCVHLTRISPHPASSTMNRRLSPNL